MILPCCVAWGQVVGVLPATARLMQRWPLPWRRGDFPYYALVFYWPEAIGQPEGAWYAIGFGAGNPRVTLPCESEERARMAARAQRWVKSYRMRFPWNAVECRGA